MTAGVWAKGAEEKLCISHHPKEQQESYLKIPASSEVCVRGKVEPANTEAWYMGQGGMEGDLCYQEPAEQKEVWTAQGRKREKEKQTPVRRRPHSREIHHPQEKQGEKGRERIQNRWGPKRTENLAVTGDSESARWFSAVGDNVCTRALPGSGREN